MIARCRLAIMIFFEGYSVQGSWQKIKLNMAITTLRLKPCRLERYVLMDIKMEHTVDHTVVTVILIF